MVKNKMLVIEKVSKDKIMRIIKMNAKNKAEVKRRIQIETTKILYFKYETNQ